MNVPIVALAAVAAGFFTLSGAAPQSPGDPRAPAAAEGFRGDVAASAKDNADFRRVVFTGPHVQLVVMSLRPGENIGLETHEVDQCLFIVQGRGTARMGDQTSRIGDESVVCIPAGMAHDIVNGKDGSMKLFTVYAPPQHPPGTVHATKADAERAEATETKG